MSVDKVQQALENLGNALARLEEARALPAGDAVPEFRALYQFLSKNSAGRVERLRCRWLCEIQPGRAKAITWSLTSGFRIELPPTRKTTYSLPL